MNYNSLFNLLYSTEISEATKAEIVSKLNQPIEESVEVQPLVETYLELLDTLVFSTASESLIYNIIDETFSQLDEEFINEVSNEWVKRKVQDSMAARKAAADSADKSIKGGVIGLSQIRKHDIAHNNLEKGQAKADSIMNKVERRKAVAAEQKASEPKKEGVMGKLKSAVGKVKSWASSVDKGPEHVGLSRMIGAKANKENIGAETLRQQTTHKEEAPKAEVKTPEPKAEAPKAKKVSKPKVKKEQTPKEVKPQEIKAEVKQPEVKAEVKADDATKAAKKVAKKTTAKTKATKETIKQGKKKVADAITTKKIKKVEEKPQEVKAETPKVEEKPQKSAMDKMAAKLKRETEARRKDQERLLQTYKDRKSSMTSKPGYDEAEVKDLDDRIAKLEKELGAAKVNEAFADFVVLLLNSNISESCFVEVVEMAGASKANALKVKDRYDQDMSASIDDINKDLEAGKPMDPEKVKKAEELMKKKEHFEKMFKDKFSDNK